VTSPIIQGRCDFCGASLDVWRAPRIRFSAGKQWLFCCAEHADQFAIPPLSSLAALLPEQGRLPLPTVPSGPSVSQVQEKAQPVADSWQLSSGQGLASDVQGVCEPTLVREQTTALGQTTGLSSEWGGADVFHDHEQGGDEPDLRVAGPSPSRLYQTIATEARSPLDLSLAFLPLIPLLVLAFTTATILIQGGAFLGHSLAFSILLFAQLWNRHTTAGSPSWGDWPSVLNPGSKEQARITDHSQLTYKEASTLRAGEEIVVRSGESICVDGVVSLGQAEIRPWPFAPHRITVKEGSRIVAGAEVVAGQLGIVATKTGEHRAFHRPTAFLREHSLLRVVRFAFLVGGPAAAMLTSLVLFWEGQSGLQVLAAGAAVGGALSLPGAVTLCTSIVVRAISESARRGIAFCDAPLFERAGQVNSVVYCARGTVLHGEPDVAEVHVFREATEKQVLGLAAGAESAVHHPIASSILRAAHERGAPVDACRGHHVISGLGVICSSSEGRAAVVGSRELLLREKVSVALAEETLRGLEARGMSTLLVAVDRRLIGVLGLQDGLRAGARATFQLLLDSGIEPILLSGDARATTEAVAQSLGCEHVRPEVPALARALEVRNLIDSGSTLAVVGNSPRDDVALGAAQVPILLDGAAVIRADSPHGHERGVGMANDRVLDSAIALLIARTARRLLLGCLSAWLIPAGAGALLVMTQLVPLFVAPLLGVLGVIFGTWRSRRPLGPQAAM
jgi:P-type E1-E2 ATPase